MFNLLENMDAHFLYKYFIMETSTFKIIRKYMMRLLKEMYNLYKWIPVNML